MKDSDRGVDPEPKVQALLLSLKQRLRPLRALLRKVDGHWAAEDGVYRFYHQSWKVYRLQSFTEEIVDALRGVAPERELNPWFLQIVRDGTAKEFQNGDNHRWLDATRPILEAFFHARYFLAMAVKYASKFPTAPAMMPSGWAAVLYLYGLRCTVMLPRPHFACDHAGWTCGVETTRKGMSVADWLAAFRDLHEQASADKLSPEEWSTYRAGREELARALVAAQRLTLRAGETPRQVLRVSRALQVDLEWPKVQVRALTIDLSVRGFATLLAKAPAKSDDVRYVLRLPGGADLKGVARVVDIRVQLANVRVALAFKDLAEPDRDRLEFVMFDTVLQQLAR